MFAGVHANSCINIRWPLWASIITYLTCLQMMWMMMAIVMKMTTKMLINSMMVELLTTTMMTMTMR
eukprot:3350875-Karenia_brevis.AAC.1